jgi:hypothetical protein
LASLGGLVSLQQLSMKGCRGSRDLGNPLEKKIWAAIKAERKKRKLCD